MSDEYQPRTRERLIEILQAQDQNPRSWQAETVVALRAFSPPEPTEKLTDPATHRKAAREHISNWGAALSNTDMVASAMAMGAARAMPLQDHGNATVLHEDVISGARAAVQKWADWCHQNEAQWSGWGDMVVPPGATAWTEAAEKVLASFPAMVAEEGTKS
jgi:hypothetical protein